MKGHAPGWQVRCLKCGHTVDAAEAGFTRMGAFGKTYTLGRCQSCARVRFVCVEKMPGADAVPFTMPPIRVIIGLGGFVLFMVFVFPLGLRALLQESPGYKAAGQAVRTSLSAQDRLGEPMEFGEWRGSIRNGRADIRFLAYGPDGEAWVHAIGEKVDGAWDFQVLDIDPIGGEVPIDGGETGN